MQFEACEKLLVVMNKRMYAIWRFCCLHVHTPEYVQNTLACDLYAVFACNTCIWPRPVKWAGGHGRSDALAGPAAPHKSHARTLIVVCLRAAGVQITLLTPRLAITTVPT